MTFDAPFTGSRRCCIPRQLIKDIDAIHIPSQIKSTILDHFISVSLRITTPRCVWRRNYVLAQPSGRDLYKLLYQERPATLVICATTSPLLSVLCLRDNSTPSHGVAGKKLIHLVSSCHRH
ncbi:hypothetical protein AcV7_007001, partial [Taiwanofungus camphoratus]